MQRKERKGWEKRNVFSLDLKTVTVTIFGREFQTARAEHRQHRTAPVNCYPTNKIHYDTHNYGDRTDGSSGNSSPRMSY